MRMGKCSIKVYMYFPISILSTYFCMVFIPHKDLVTLAKKNEYCNMNICVVVRKRVYVKCYSLSNADTKGLFGVHIVTIVYTCV